MSKDNKLIQLRTETYNKLHSLGKYGDTFDSIVARLLEQEVPEFKKGDLEIG